MAARTYHDGRPVRERLAPIVSAFVRSGNYMLALGMPHDLFDEFMAMDDEQAEFDLLLEYLATGNFKTPIMDHDEG